MAGSKDEVRAKFNELLNTYNKDLREIKKQIRKTSILRIAIFLITVLGIYIASTFGWLYLILTTVIGFGGFIFLVYKHSKYFKTRTWLENLIQINQTELSLLDRNTKGLDTGSEFNIPDHSFSGDLDIFGNRSLFQLINRCATNSGKESLANTLNKPVKNITRLLERQKTIAELSRKITWRQHFQAVGMLSEEPEDATVELISWATSSSFSFDRLIYKILLWLNPIIGLAIVFSISFNMLGFGSFILFLGLPFFIIGTKLTIINKEHGQLGRKGKLLGKYAELFNLVESEKLNSTLMINAQKDLSTGSNSAKKAIQQLSKISASFDYRLNFLVGIVLNIFFLWDIRQSIRLEKWKVKNGEMLSGWFDTLSDVDEMNSIAGFAYAHPNAVFPSISSEPFTLIAREVKHPFIPDEESVGNIIEFTGWKQFQVITGANMAGKSTYLRTVGVNLLLAMAGAPVLAEKFKFTPVNLFTGIKTSDSLQDGESYFFAELKRLKSLIDLLEEGNQIFIILDEILRGTNSHDKQKGSKALISQLIRLGASGMIATHDLSLGELKKSFSENIENKRFEVEIENAELVFDYKLKEGVSQNLNASFLMEKMGIVLEE